MLRTKVNDDGSFNENSYNASDSVNSLKWSTLEDGETSAVYEYYKGLIAFRKAHPALRLTNAEDVKANVTAVDGLNAGLVAMEVAGGVNGESAEGLFLIFNASADAQQLALPEGSWDVYVDAGHAGIQVLDTLTGAVTVEPISAMVLVKAAE